MKQTNGPLMSVMYSGDECYGDDITSGIWQDADIDEVSPLSHLDDFGNPSTVEEENQ